MNAVGEVGAYDSDNLCGVYLQHSSTDAVAGLVDGYFATIGRIERHIYVMKAFDCFGNCLVELNDDLLSKMGYCG